MGQEFQNNIVDSWDVFISRLNAFFNSERLSSTYKPVFLKCLIAISYIDESNPKRLVGYQWLKIDRNRVKVDLNFIAARYLHFYWSLAKFKLKQSLSPQDANINRIIREAAFESDAAFEPKTPRLETLVDEKYSALRSLMIKKN